MLPILVFIAALAMPGFTPAAYAQGDTQPPIVIGISPLPGGISQDVTTSVTASFSEAIQPASVAFVLKDSAGVIVPASVTYDSSTNTATLRPASDLAAARTYTATLSAATDLAGNAMVNPSVWSFSTGQPGFRESVVFSGLQNPTAFQFASDGRVFVAEKSGLILIFDNLTDATPSVFADMRATVDSSGNRGLSGLALDPGFPAVPYVYVFYSYAVGSGGVAQGRVSRFQATGNVQTGGEQVLVNDWYQRYPDQSVGNLAFGPDGNLYAAAGDGASAAMVDVGQTDSPSPDPTNEGGALRSQDLRTPADPVTLDGSVIRINPNTGKAVRATTSMTVGAPTVDANGVKSYPVTSVYQGSQPQVVRVLEPTNPAAGRPRRLLYVLPVSAGVTNQGSQFGDGLEELRLLDVANRFNMTLIAPSFAYEPWYGDNVTDPTLWMETFIVRELVPWGDTFLPAGTTPQRFLIGFSKSGNGALILIFRHPNVFSAAAAWDSPAQLNDVTAFSGLPLNFGTQANYNRYFIPTLVTAGAQQFTGSNRLWISGDQSSWTADMIQLHSQLTSASIQHTWVAGGTRAHSWSSGWLDGAVTALDANAGQLPAADTNEPRIIAYGLRSPRIAVRPGSQELWVADRGSSTEEINRIPNSGDGNVENFAWPCYEAGVSTGYSGSSICSALQSQPAQLTAPFFSYLHQQQVVAGNEGGIGSGAISGLAFYGAGSYPGNYQGSLFFADRARNNIWVMFKDVNGNLNPANIANFVLGAASPTDLETGPGGDLFYADENGGTIRRIRFVEPIGRSGGQPSGILAAGTTQTPVTLATDQNAICRYATTAGVSYGSMPNTFATTGGTAHSTLLTGLVNGGVYALFVRCATAAGDRNPDDYPISFSVGRPPAITSVNTTTFTVVTPVSFLVTATGTPTPSLTESGTLPSGVTFHDNGNGTATLSGPAAGGTAGVYPLTITASNGGGAPATQNFTLTVSAGSGGGPANFTYVTGSVTGVVDFGGDTAATLAIPLHQSPGTGHLLMCAATWQSPTATASMSDPNNGTWIPIGTARTGVGNLATYRGQMFYTPAAVSAPTTVTLTISSAVGFRAFECAEYSYNGTLAFLDGTPQYSTTQASAGVATVNGLTTTNSSELLFAACLAVDSTCSAGSGFTGLDDTNTSFKDRGVTGQSFRSGTGQLIEHKVGVAAGAQTATFLTGTSDPVILGMVAVTANAQTSPTITSASTASLTAGSAGSFTITTAGTPTPFLTETGPLPSGVTFVNNGNGTATLSGTPAAGTAGSYALTITASNGVGTPATQILTLTINQALAITSAASATFTATSAASFTVTTTGTPTPTVTKTGALPSGVTFVGNANGTATLSGTPAAGTAGNYPLTITASNGVGTPATQSFTLTVNQSPAITSAASTTFTTGTAGSFIVTVTGTPTPTVIQTGALPNGVTFVNNGNGTATLSGTPAAGTAGSYAITITASNGVGTSAAQSFTLTVNAQVPPAITSPASTTFTVGAPGSFQVVATGTPTPSLAAAGALPTGVTFADNGNGTATLSGTPAAGTGGSYAITITAGNGGGSPATQSFTLAVNQAPVITSAASATFTVGAARTVSITTTGTPSPSLSETGPLPSGVTFVSNGNGTATLSGTAAAGTVGSYPITIAANNGVGTPATQSFTLTVNQAPAITSAGSTIFTAGSAGNFTITTTGTPTPSVTATGALPSGLTFVNNGNGTATLSGTAAAGTAGSYPITITASNGVGTPATQSLTLTVNQAPAITSAAGVIFATGAAGTFTVTANGAPTPSVTETGALPNGVTFVDNGSGTATLSGTPAEGTAGSYAITITASNGVGTPATQNFTLTVNQQTAPAITSSAGTTFTVAAPGNFVAIATGSPTPSLAATGALPGGVTFVASGNGTATLTGTPAAGTAGSYAITITATNGVGTPATQSFTLTVNQAPAITSGTSATFTAGTAGSFSVTATGAPTPSVTQTGALPGGVTFVDNGNGTATLSGTPSAGTAGSYALTITATNGVGTPATQSVTLTVNQAPAITSGASATFTAGSAGSFTITATGTPTPVVTKTGALPTGVTFVSNGNGTATLSGTPAAGTAGSYAMTVTATNGVGTPATQSFTLTVNQAPAITSANSSTFTVGTAKSFTITTTGTPAPSLSETGALPGGVTFTSNGNGTATLSGTAAAGTAGSYAITITAANGAGTPATQSFTLTVNQPPAITSASGAAFTVSAAGSFTVTTTGSPSSTLTETGALPNGVTFVNNGNGTATLSGTPAGGTAGSYALTLTATNGVGTPATQSFTLTVRQAPAITSATSATFFLGAAGTFTVTTTGSPAPSLSENGALPSGVTFVNNGNGTATLSGTPAAGTVGSYPITITASNGVGTPATQAFTLTVGSTAGGPSNFAYVTGSVTGVVDFGGDTGATLPIALHQTPGAGHLLVCAATWASPTATATMSDPNNGTWTPAGAAKTGGGDLAGYRGQMFYVPAAVSASTTVTLTLGSAVGFRAFECAEFSYTGILALDGIPQYSTTPASAGTATVGGLTTTNASDLLFASCLAVDTTCAVGTGFTALDDINTSFKDRGLTGQSFKAGTGQLIQFRVGVAAGVQSATFKTGATDPVILGLVAF